MTECSLARQEIQVPEKFTVVVPGDDEPNAIHCQFTCPECARFVSKAYVLDFNELPFRVLVMPH